MLPRCENQRQQIEPLLFRQRLQKLSGRFRIDMGIRQAISRIDELEVFPIAVRDRNRRSGQLDMAAFRQFGAVLIGSDFDHTGKQGRQPDAVQQSGPGFIADPDVIPDCHIPDDELVKVRCDRPEYRLLDAAVDAFLQPFDFPAVRHPFELYIRGSSCLIIRNEKPLGKPTGNLLRPYQLFKGSASTILTISSPHPVCAIYVTAF